MKSYTDIEQSRNLAKILPIESADAHYVREITDFVGNSVDRKWSEAKLGNPEKANYFRQNFSSFEKLPCWSLAALLNAIKDKCGYFEFVYLKQTSDSKANPLEDVCRLSTNVYDVYKKEAVDACYEMIIKLNELKLL